MMHESFGHKEAYYVQDKKHLSEFLMKMKKNGDIVVTLGAGDISKYGGRIYRRN